jgi:hypothetical protein
MPCYCLYTSMGQLNYTYRLYVCHMYIFNLCQNYERVMSMSTWYVFTMINWIIYYHYRSGYFCTHAYILEIDLKALHPELKMQMKDPWVGTTITQTFVLNFEFAQLVHVEPCAYMWWSYNVKSDGYLWKLCNLLILGCLSQNQSLRCSFDLHLRKSSKLRLVQIQWRLNKTSFLLELNNLKTAEIKCYEHNLWEFVRKTMKL